MWIWTGDGADGNVDAVAGLGGWILIRGARQKAGQLRIMAAFCSADRLLAL